MYKGLKLAKIAGMVLLCLGILNADATKAPQHSRRKAVKKNPPADLPSGPTGRAVPQIPLDSITPVSPQVNFQNGQLTIVAPNSTLADILRAVRKQTGAEIEIPSATDRVVTRLGPGPARDVMAELLNGSRFNYVLLGSPEDANALTRVVLVAKSGPENAPPSGQQAAQPQQNAPAEADNAQQPEPEENNDAEATEENPDDNVQPTPDGEQPAQQPEQPGVKTPQQLLQEMQQRQLQMQQQQPGQPPVPGPGVPPPGQPQQEQQEQNQ